MSKYSLGCQPQYLATQPQETLATWKSDIKGNLNLHLKLVAWLLRGLAQNLLYFKLLEG
jgi:hypothetical protein